jgi:hypothetical protein
MSTVTNDNTTSVSLLNFLLERLYPDVYYASEQLHIGKQLYLTDQEDGGKRYLVIDTSCWSQGKDVIRLPIKTTAMRPIDVITDLRERRKKLRNELLLP